MYVQTHCTAFVIVVLIVDAADTGSWHLISVCRREKVAVLSNFPTVHTIILWWAVLFIPGLLSASQLFGDPDSRPYTKSYGPDFLDS